ncbi:MAG: hypothetical protein ACLGIO_00680 [Acidimicrobiia bacterium]
MSEKDEQGTESGGGYVSTNPNEAAAEHEPMAVADSDHKQDPGEQAGGGQHGG